MTNSATRRNAACEAILIAAARRFAERGYTGASIREILRDAGANVAAARYHFGSKEDLYREVVRRFLLRVGEERIITLRALEHQPSETLRGRLEALIRGYVEPHLRLCADPKARDYVQLLARSVAENEDLMGRIYAEILEPARSLYVKAIATTVPEVPSADVSRFFSFMVSLMVTSPVDVAYGSLTGRSPWPHNPQRLIAQIVAFVTAGILDSRQRTAERDRIK